MIQEDDNKMICETLNRIFRTLLKTNRGVEVLVESQEVEKKLMWEMYEELQHNRKLLSKIEEDIKNNNNNKPSNFQLRLSFKQTKLQGDNVTMNITTEQQVSCTVAATTAGGAPAQIFGNVVFTSSDPTIASITPVDATSCVVVGLAVGAAQINAVFEGDPTPGVDTITLSGAINVVAPEAVSGEVTFGTPTLKPAPAPAPAPTPGA